MKEYLLPISQCMGKVLAETVLLGDNKYPKGIEIKRELIEAAIAADLDVLPVIEWAADEYTESQVLDLIVNRFEKEATSVKKRVGGKALLTAKKAGLFCYSSLALHTFNAKNTGLFVSAIASDSWVEAGDLLVVFKLVPFAVKKQEVETVLAGPLRFQVFSRANTKLQLLICEQEKKQLKIKAAVKQRLLNLGLEIENKFFSPPNEAAFEELLKKMLEAKGSCLIALPSSPLSLENRWLNLISKQGVEWIQMGIPIEPGHFTILGKFKRQTSNCLEQKRQERYVLVLPGCAKLSAKPNGLDKVLQRMKMGADLDSRACLDWGLQSFE